MTSLITDPLFYVAAIPAVILMGLAKGGFAGLGLIAIPLMALVVSPIKAAALMLPILIVQDMVSTWAYRHVFDRRTLMIMLPGCLGGVVLGWFFTITNLIKVVPYFLLGQFSTENLGTSSALFPVALISTLAGIWLVRRMDPARFYTIIYVLTFAVGAKLIFDSLPVLF